MANGETTLNVNTTMTPAVAEAVENLISSLLQAEPIAAYQKARAAMDTHEVTQVLLKQYTAAQTDFRELQANGTLTQDHIDRMRQLQQEVQADPQVAAFVVAQFAARTFLDKLTDDLSDGLGIEFASLANASSCC